MTNLCPNFRRLLGTWIVTTLCYAGTCVGNGASADEFLKDVGNWSLFTRTADDGSSNACYAQADYVSGSSLFLLYDFRDGYEIYLRDDDWNIPAGNTYPVSIEIDNFGPWDAEIDAVETDTMYFGVNEAFIAEFKRGLSMVIIARNQNLYFDLDGTARMVDAVMNCVRRNDPKGRKNPFGQTNASNNPFGQKSSGTTTTAETDQSLTETEATEYVDYIVNAVLDDTQYGTVRMLDPSEEPDLFGGSVLRWIGDEVFGAAALFEGDSDTVMADFLSINSKNCTGKFGSVKDRVTVDDGIELYQLGTICDADGEAYHSNFLFIPLPPFQIVITHISIDQPIAQDFDHAFVASFDRWLKD